MDVARYFLSDEDEDAAAGAGAGAVAAGVAAGVVEGLPSEAGLAVESLVVVSPEDLGLALP